MSYKKSCAGMFLQKFSKSGKLLRQAEQFNSGNWVVHVFGGINIAGEYTPSEFEKVKKYF